MWLLSDLQIWSPSCHVAKASNRLWHRGTLSGGGTICKEVWGIDSWRTYGKHCLKQPMRKGMGYRIISAYPPTSPYRPEVLKVLNIWASMGQILSWNRDVWIHLFFKTRTGTKLVMDSHPFWPQMIIQVKPTPCPEEVPKGIEGECQLNTPEVLTDTTQVLFWGR